MKRILIGSTALLAAGMIAGPTLAQEALTGSNLDLSLGGDISMQLKYQSKETSIADTDKERNHDFDLDGEMHFMGEAATDGGLSFGFEVEMEIAGGGAAAGGDFIDQNWIWVDGRFGKVYLGAKAHSSLDAAGDTETYSGVAILAGDKNTNEATSFGDAIDNPSTGTTDEMNKLIWEPPAVGNVTFAINYTPDTTSQNTTANSDNDDTSEADKDLMIAAEYETTVSGTDLTIEAAWAQARPENAAVDPDLKKDTRTRFAIEATQGDLDVGGFWMNFTEYAEEVQPTEDRRVTGVFAQYEIGDWTVGASYRRSVADEMSAGTPNTKDGEDKAAQANIGLTYDGLGNGRTLKIGYETQKWDDDADVATEEQSTNSLDLKLEWDVADGLEFDLGYQNFRYTHHDGLSTSAKRTGHAFVATTKISF